MFTNVESVEEHSPRRNPGSFTINLTKGLIIEKELAKGKEELAKNQPGPKTSKKRNSLCDLSP